MGPVVAALPSCPGPPLVNSAFYGRGRAGVTASNAFRVGLWRGSWQPTSRKGFATWPGRRSASLIHFLELKVMEGKRHSLCLGIVNQTNYKPELPSAMGKVLA